MSPPQPSRPDTTEAAQSPSGACICDEHAFADLGPDHFKWDGPDDA
jgi:hypothetical protein